MLPQVFHSKADLIRHMEGYGGGYQDTGKVFLWHACLEPEPFDTFEELQAYIHDHGGRLTSYWKEGDKTRFQWGP